MSRILASNFAITKSCGKQSQALGEFIRIVPKIPDESTISAISEEVWKVHGGLSELYENHKEMSPHIQKVDQK